MKGWQQPSPSQCAAAGHTSRLPENSSECWSLGALYSLCSPAALFHCTHWHLIAVAGRQKQMLFNKSCNMRLNILQLNIGNITKNTRPNNQVGGKVQQALRAASTWPESCVVSSLSLFFFLVIVPQHFWFIGYLFPCFACWGWYCKAVLGVRHQPRFTSCQYRQWPVALGERTNSGQGRQLLNS